MSFSEVALNIAHPLRDRPVKMTSRYTDPCLQLYDFIYERGAGLQRPPDGEIMLLFKQNAHDSERAMTLERKHYKTPK